MSDDNKTPTMKDAEAVTIAPPKPGQASFKEAGMYQHNEEMQRLQLGWVGRIWGNRAEKPGNLSAIIALVLSAYLGILFF